MPLSKIVQRLMRHPAFKRLLRFCAFKRRFRKGRENEMGYIVHFAMKSKKGHALDLQATYS